MQMYLGLHFFLFPIELHMMLPQFPANKEDEDAHIDR